MQVRFSLPFADTEHLGDAEIKKRQAGGRAWSFRIAYKLRSRDSWMRPLLAGFYEDHWDTQATPLNDYMPTSMATLAIKLDA